MNEKQANIDKWIHLLYIRQTKPPMNLFYHRSPYQVAFEGLFEFVKHVFSPLLELILKLTVINQNFVFVLTNC